MAAVSSWLDELQARSDLDLAIHVDGASGGFLAPFCAPELGWDWRLPRVKSINASGHKFGLAPLGAGVWREKIDLPEDLVFNVNYLGGNMPTFALNFSRPDGQVIVKYYSFLRLGREEAVKNQLIVGDQRGLQSCPSVGPAPCFLGGNPSPSRRRAGWVSKYSKARRKSSSKAATRPWVTPLRTGMRCTTRFSRSGGML